MASRASFLDFWGPPILGHGSISFPHIFGYKLRYCSKNILHAL